MNSVTILCGFDKGHIPYRERNVSSSPGVRTNKLAYNQYHFFMGGHTHSVDVIGTCAATQCTSSALNRSVALHWFERGNVIQICIRIMLEFFPGLPYV